MFSGQKSSLRCLFLKTTATIVLITFILDTILTDLVLAQPTIQKSTLSIWTVSERPEAKRTLIASLYRQSNLIHVADTPFYRELLKGSHDLAVRIPTSKESPEPLGRYLMAEETARNDLLLIRAAMHEDFEILMKEEPRRPESDPARYLKLKRKVLKNALLMEIYRAISRHKNIAPNDNDVIFNDLIATAFELLYLIKKSIINAEKDLTPEEIKFVKMITPILLENRSGLSFADAFFKDLAAEGRDGPQGAGGLEGLAAGSREPQDGQGSETAPDEDIITLDLKGGMDADRILGLLKATVETEEASGAAQIIITKIEGNSMPGLRWQHIHLLYAEGGIYQKAAQRVLEWRDRQELKRPGRRQLEGPAEWVKAPAEDLEARIDGATLMGLIPRLTDKQEKLTINMWLEGHTTREIGEALGGLAPGSVEFRLNSAIANLKRLSKGKATRQEIECQRAEGIRRLAGIEDFRMPTATDRHIALKRMQQIVDVCVERAKKFREEGSYDDALTILEGLKQEISRFGLAPSKTGWILEKVENNIRRVIKKKEERLAAEKKRGQRRLKAADKVRVLNKMRRMVNDGFARVRRHVGEGAYRRALDILRTRQKKVEKSGLAPSTALPILERIERGIEWVSGIKKERGEERKLKSAERREAKKLRAIEDRRKKREDDRQKAAAVPPVITAPEEAKEKEAKKVQKKPISPADLEELLGDAYATALKGRLDLALEMLRKAHPAADSASKGKITRRMNLLTRLYGKSLQKGETDNRFIIILAATAVAFGFFVTLFKGYGMAGAIMAGLAAIAVSLTLLYRFTHEESQAMRWGIFRSFKEKITALSETLKNKIEIFRFGKENFYAKHLKSDSDGEVIMALEELSKLDTEKTRVILREQFYRAIVLGSKDVQAASIIALARLRDRGLRTELCSLVEKEGDWKVILAAAIALYSMFNRIDLAVDSLEGAADTEGRSHAMKTLMVALLTAEASENLMAFKAILNIMAEMEPLAGTALEDDDEVRFLDDMEKDASGEGDIDKLIREKKQQREYERILIENMKTLKDGKDIMKRLLAMAFLKRAAVEFADLGYKDKIIRAFNIVRKTEKDRTVLAYLEKDLFDLGGLSRTERLWFSVKRLELLTGAVRSFLRRHKLIAGAMIWSAFIMLHFVNTQHAAAAPPAYPEIFAGVSRLDMVNMLVIGALQSFQEPDKDGKGSANSGGGADKPIREIILKIKGVTDNEVKDEILDGGLLEGLLDAVETGSKCHITVVPQNIRSYRILQRFGFALEEPDRRIREVSETVGIAIILEQGGGRLVEGVDFAGLDLRMVIRKDSDRSILGNMMDLKPEEAEHILSDDGVARELKRREEELALRAKGLVQYDGEWMTAEEAHAREMTAKGLVKHGDKWVTPEERTRLIEEERLAGEKRREDDEKQRNHDRALRKIAGVLEKGNAALAGKLLAQNREFLTPDEILDLERRIKELGEQKAREAEVAKGTEESDREKVPQSQEPGIPPALQIVPPAIERKPQDPAAQERLQKATLWEIERNFVMHARREMLRERLKAHSDERDQLDSEYKELTKAMRSTAQTLISRLIRDFPEEVTRKVITLAISRKPDFYREWIRERSMMEDLKRLEEKLKSLQSVGEREEGIPWQISGGLSGAFIDYHGADEVMRHIGVLQAIDRRGVSLAQIVNDAVAARDLRDRRLERQLLSRFMEILSSPNCNKLRAEIFRRLNEKEYDGAWFSRTAKDYDGSYPVIDAIFNTAALVLTDWDGIVPRPENALVLGGRGVRKDHVFNKFTSLPRILPKATPPQAEKAGAVRPEAAAPTPPTITHSTAAPATPGQALPSGQKLVRQEARGSGILSEIDIENPAKYEDYDYLKGVYVNLLRHTITQDNGTILSALTGIGLDADGNPRLAVHRVARDLGFELALSNDEIAEMLYPKDILAAEIVVPDRPETPYGLRIKLKSMHKSMGGEFDILPVFIRKEGAGDISLAVDDFIGKDELAKLEIKEGMDPAERERRGLILAGLGRDGRVLPSCLDYRMRSVTLLVRLADTLGLDRTGVIYKNLLEKVRRREEDISREKRGKDKEADRLRDGLKTSLKLPLNRNIELNGIEAPQQNGLPIPDMARILEEEFGFAPALAAGELDKLLKDEYIEAVEIIRPARRLVCGISMELPPYMKVVFKKGYELDVGYQRRAATDVEKRSVCFYIWNGATKRPVYDLSRYERLKEGNSLARTAGGRAAISELFASGKAKAGILYVLKRPETLSDALFKGMVGDELDKSLKRFRMVYAAQPVLTAEKLCPKLAETAGTTHGLAAGEYGRLIEGARLARESRLPHPAMYVSNERNGFFAIQNGRRPLPFDVAISSGLVSFDSMISRQVPNRDGNRLYIFNLAHPVAKVFGGTKEADGLYVQFYPTQIFSPEVARQAAGYRQNIATLKSVRENIERMSAEMAAWIDKRSGKIAGKDFVERFIRENVSFIKSWSAIHMQSADICMRANLYARNRGLLNERLDAFEEMIRQEVDSKLHMDRDGNVKKTARKFHAAFDRFKKTILDELPLQEAMNELYAARTDFYNALYVAILDKLFADEAGLAKKTDEKKADADKNIDNVVHALYLNLKELEAYGRYMEVAAKLEPAIAKISQAYDIEGRARRIEAAVKSRGMSEEEFQEASGRLTKTLKEAVILQLFSSQIQSLKSCVEAETLKKETVRSAAAYLLESIEIDAGMKDEKLAGTLEAILETLTDGPSPANWDALERIREAVNDRIRGVLAEAEDGLFTCYPKMTAQEIYDLKVLYHISCLERGIEHYCEHARGFLASYESEPWQRENSAILYAVTQAYIVYLDHLLESVMNSEDIESYEIIGKADDANLWSLKAATKDVPKGIMEVIRERGLRPEMGPPVRMSAYLVRRPDGRLEVRRQWTLDQFIFGISELCEKTDAEADFTPEMAVRTAYFEAVPHIEDIADLRRGLPVLMLHVDRDDPKKMTARLFRKNTDVALEDFNERVKMIISAVNDLIFPDSGAEKEASDNIAALKKKAFGEKDSLTGAEALDKVGAVKKDYIQRIVYGFLTEYIGERGVLDKAKADLDKEADRIFGLNSDCVFDRDRLDSLLQAAHVKVIEALVDRFLVSPDYIYVDKSVRFMDGEHAVDPDNAGLTDEDRMALAETARLKAAYLGGLDEAQSSRLEVLSRLLVAGSASVVWVPLIRALVAKNTGGNFAMDDKSFRTVCAALGSRMDAGDVRERLIAEGFAEVLKGGEKWHEDAWRVASISLVSSLGLSGSNRLDNLRRALLRAIVPNDAAAALGAATGLNLNFEENGGVSETEFADAVKRLKKEALKPRIEALTTEIGSLRAGKRFGEILAKLAQLMEYDAELAEKVRGEIMEELVLAAAAAIQAAVEEVKALPLTADFNNNEKVVAAEAAMDTLKSFAGDDSTAQQAAVLNEAIRSKQEERRRERETRDAKALAAVDKAIVYITQFVGAKYREIEQVKDAFSAIRELAELDEDKAGAYEERLENTLARLETMGGIFRNLQRMEAELGRLPIERAGSIEVLDTIADEFEGRAARIDGAMDDLVRLCTKSALPNVVKIGLRQIEGSIRKGRKVIEEKRRALEPPAAMPGAAVTTQGTPQTANGAFNRVTFITDLHAFCRGALKGGLTLEGLDKVRASVDALPPEEHPKYRDVLIEHVAKGIDALITGLTTSSEGMDRTSLAVSEQRIMALIARLPDEQERPGYIQRLNTAKAALAAELGVADAIDNFKTEIARANSRTINSRAGKVRELIATTLPAGRQEVYLARVQHVVAKRLAVIEARKRGEVIEEETPPVSPEMPPVTQEAPPVTQEAPKSKPQSMAEPVTPPVKVEEPKSSAPVTPPAEEAPSIAALEEGIDIFNQGLESMIEARKMDRPLVDRELRELEGLARQVITGTDPKLPENRSAKQALAALEKTGTILGADVRSVAEIVYEGIDLESFRSPGVRTMVTNAHTLITRTLNYVPVSSKPQPEPEAGKKAEKRKDEEPRKKEKGKDAVRKAINDLRMAVRNKDQDAIARLLPSLKPKLEGAIKHGHPDREEYGQLLSKAAAIISGGGKEAPKGCPASLLRYMFGWRSGKYDQALVIDKTRPAMPRDMAFKRGGNDSETTIYNELKVLEALGLVEGGKGSPRYLSDLALELGPNEIMEKNPELDKPSLSESELILLKAKLEAQTAFKRLDQKAREESLLNRPVAELSSSCQRMRPQDVTRLKFVVPVEVFKNSADLRIVMKNLGLINPKERQEKIPFELVIAGVKKDDEELIRGLNERSDIRRSLGLPENPADAKAPKDLNISVITEEEISDWVEWAKARVNKALPYMRAIAMMQLSLRGAPPAQGELIGIATDPVEEADAKDLEEGLKYELKDNISIRVVVKRSGEARTIYSLSDILDSWLKAIQDGNRSSIAKILPKMLTPAELAEDLASKILAALTALSAA